MNSSSFLGWERKLRTLSNDMAIAQQQLTELIGTIEKRKKKLDELLSMANAVRLKEKTNQVT